MADTLVKSVKLNILTDPGTALEKMDALNAKAERLKKTLGDGMEVKIDTAAANIKLALLRQDLLRTSTVGDGGGGRGGIGGILGGLFGAGGGAGAGAAPLLGAAVAAAPGPAAIAGGIAGAGVVLSGSLGIIPMIAAAGAGIAAFGALAVPTFSAISGAITQIKTDTAAYDAATTALAKSTALAKVKADWAALDPAQKSLVVGIQGIQTQFGNMATALAPLTEKIMAVGVNIAQKLLPVLEPFAKAAGGAILGLLTQFDKFVVSPGFKSFIDNFTKLSGPTITTIGEGIGRVGVAVGKLMLALENPNAIRVLRGLFDMVEWTTQGIAWAFRTLTPVVIGFYDKFAENTKAMVGWFTNAFSTVSRILTVDIPSWVGAAVHAGEAIIGGLIHGIESSLGPLGTFLGGISTFIARHKGPIQLDAQLLFPHGQAMIGGLMAGMSSRLPQLQGQLAGITGTVGGYGGLAYGGGAGGGRVVNYYITNNVPANANMTELGRITVEAIRKFEMSSGKGWRS